MIQSKSNQSTTRRAARSCHRRRLGVIAFAGVSALVVAGLLAPMATVNAQRSGGPATIARAPLSFADIVERVKPAVVAIKVVRKGGSFTFNRSPNRGPRGDRGRTPRGGPPGAMPNIPEDHPFYEFFRNMPRNFRNVPRRAATGSGFVISPDGYVVTNFHVIDKASKITVSFDQKDELSAKLVGTDPRTDLALLKIEKKQTFAYVKFASKPARVGDWVLAVGNPFGFGGTVTAGIVSALSRNIGSGPYDFMQIDAAVNRGNSGGPTFNLAGEVVGINTAIVSPSGGNVGIAFAVPAATASRVIDELKSKGSVTRGWLGVSIRDINRNTVESLGLKDDKGSLVAGVNSGSPADLAGIQPYDIIKSVDGKAIKNSNDLSLRIAKYSPGTSVRVVVLRGNGSKSITVKLGTFPKDPRAIAKLRSPQPSYRSQSDALGMRLELAGQNDGLRVVEVDPNSAAAKSGLSTGDFITHANQERVDSVKKLQDIIRTARRQSRSKLMLGVRDRNNRRRLVFVELKK